MDIISTRHFPYEKTTGLLTPEGRTEGEKFSSFLMYLIAGIPKNKVRIVHAPAPRCQESAEVANLMLKVGVALEECLDWDPKVIGDSHNEAVKEMIARYEAEEIEILIIISHDGMVNRIAEWYVLDRGGHLCARINLMPGQCCIILEDGRYNILPE